MYFFNWKETTPWDEKDAQIYRFSFIQLILIHQSLESSLNSQQPNRILRNLSSFF